MISSTRAAKKKAGNTATPVACGWLGAVSSKASKRLKTKKIVKRKMESTSVRVPRKAGIGLCLAKMFFSFVKKL